MKPTRRPVAGASDTSCRGVRCEVKSYQPCRQATMRHQFGVAALLRSTPAHRDSTSIPFSPWRTQLEKIAKPAAIVNHDRMQRQTIV